MKCYPRKVRIAVYIVTSMCACAKEAVSSKNPLSCTSIGESHEWKKMKGSKKAL